MSLKYFSLVDLKSVLEDDFISAHTPLVIKSKDDETTVKKIPRVLGSK